MQIRLPNVVLDHVEDVIQVGRRTLSSAIDMLQLPGLQAASLSRVRLCLYEAHPSIAAHRQQLLP